MPVYTVMGSMPSSGGKPIGIDRSAQNAGGRSAGRME